MEDFNIKPLIFKASVISHDGGSYTILQRDGIIDSCYDNKAIIRTDLWLTFEQHTKNSFHHKIFKLRVI
jgi:hypothetical protein